MSWVYRKTEQRLWTVGYYEPNGKWYPVDDFSTEKEAADRAHYLNGGKNAELSNSKAVSPTG
jgi:hypothetical protein